MQQYKYAVTGTFTKVRELTNHKHLEVNDMNLLIFFCKICKLKSDIAVRMSNNSTHHHLRSLKIVLSYISTNKNLRVYLDIMFIQKSRNISGCICTKCE